MRRSGLRTSLIILGAATLALSGCGDGGGTAAPTGTKAAPAPAPAPAAASATSPSAPSPAAGSPAASSPAGATNGTTATRVEALNWKAPLVGGGEFDAGTLSGTPVVLWFWAPG